MKSIVFTQLFLIIILSFLKVYAQETQNNLDWIKEGGSISDELTANNYGEYIALNHAGDICVVSAYDDNGAGGNLTSIGKVIVYQFDQTTFGWKQMGQTLYGTQIRGEFGHGLSINQHGNIIAVSEYRYTKDRDAVPLRGRVTVYKYNDSTKSWEQLGNVLEGLSQGDQFGWDLALNNEGDRIAVSSVSMSNSRGAVMVYTYDVDQNMWNVLGDVVLGEFEEDNFGMSVDINGLGDTFVAGAPFNNNGVVVPFYGNMASKGHSRVFEFDKQSESWKQKGQDIDGEAFFSLNGMCVAINDDGTRIAESSRTSNEGAPTGGQVRTFEWKTDKWQQLGGDIYGVQGEQIGSPNSVRFNGAGSVLAVGGMFYGENAVSAIGRIRVFGFDKSTKDWKKISNDIKGVAQNDRMGYAVAINQVGNLVLGSSKTLLNSNEVGQVQIFSNDIILNQSKKERQPVRLYPNPVTSNVVFISNKDSYYYKLFGVNGQLIRYGDGVQTEIQLGDLKKGLYVIHLVSQGVDKFKIVRKILVM